MALKACIYCSASISEHAVTCPRCEKSAPFDMSAKHRAEALKAKESADAAALLDLKRKREVAFKRNVFCPECKLEMGLDLKRRTCDRCGYPKCYQPCERCGEPASDYDTKQEKFVCQAHLAERCDSCGELIYEDKVVKTWWIGSPTCGGTHHSSTLHRKCTPEYQRERRGKMILVSVALVIAGLLVTCISR